MIYKIFHITKYHVVENIGKFTYLDYLEENTLANNLQMKYRYGKFCKFKGETLPISHQFANVSPHKVFHYTEYTLPVYEYFDSEMP